MVSFKSLFAFGCALLATATSAAPTVGKINSVRSSKTACGVEPAPGIRKPKNNSTITYTAAEQQNYDGATFEIIYCSGQYFKTSSLNATAMLLPNPASSDAGLGTNGMVLGSAVPNPEAAAPGYYGYIFNVTIYPENGNYITGPARLSVLELETGYYNAENYDLHSVMINLKKAPSSNTY